MLSAVAAEQIDDVQIVETVRQEALGMRRLDVIALDEAFQQDLPVDFELAFRRGEQALIRRDQLGQSVECGVLRRGLVLSNEDQPQLLLRRQRHQWVRLLFEAREAILMRDMAKAPFEIVGPTMVAADKGARAA